MSMGKLSHYKNRVFLAITRKTAINPKIKPRIPSHQFNPFAFSPGTVTFMPIKPLSSQ